MSIDKGIKKILSIGCGKQKASDHIVRVDISVKTNPDVVWDLNITPWPFDNDEFDFIDCMDVIEHLDNIPKVVEECHRVLKKGGALRMTTPHFSAANSYIDPTHKFHLSYFSFDVFSDTHEYEYYSDARFHMQHREIRFEGSWPRRNILRRLANKFPKLYERSWAWIFPAWFLYFELKSIK